jgi:hypothetical protein
MAQGEYAKSLHAVTTSDSEMPILTYAVNKAKASWCFFQTRDNYLNAKELESKQIVSIFRYEKSNMLLSFR